LKFLEIDSLYTVSLWMNTHRERSVIPVSTLARSVLASTYFDLQYAQSEPKKRHKEGTKKIDNYDIKKSKAVQIEISRM
jgi:hypothetical protein